MRKICSSARPRHGVVQRRCGGPVAADRLLDDDARVVGDEVRSTGGARRYRRKGPVRRPCRRRGSGRSCRSPSSAWRKAVAGFRVHGHVGEAERGGVELLLVESSLPTCSEIALRANARYSSSDIAERDAPMIRVGSVNCRQPVSDRGPEQFSLRQISGAAERDEVEWFDRDDLARHVARLLTPIANLFNLIDLNSPETDGRGAGRSLKFQRRGAVRSAVAVRRGARAGAGEPSAW